MVRRDERINAPGFGSVPSTISIHSDVYPICLSGCGELLKEEVERPLATRAKQDVTEMRATRTTSPSRPGSPSGRGAGAMKIVGGPLCIRRRHGHRGQPPSNRSLCRACTTVALGRNHPFVDCSPGKVELCQTRHCCLCRSTCSFLVGPGVCGRSCFVAWKKTKESPDPVNELSEA